MSTNQRWSRQLGASYRIPWLIFTIVLAVTVVEEATDGDPSAVSLAIRSLGLAFSLTCLTISVLRGMKQHQET